MYSYQQKDDDMMKMIDECPRRDDPDVGHTRCCFAVYSMKRFALLFYVLPCYFVLVVFRSLALRLPRLGKRELILVLFVRLFDLRLLYFVCLVLGRVAVCDCGTPWTILLPFL